MRRLTKATLRLMRIFNSQGLCQAAKLEAGVFIAYQAPDRGRGGFSASWRIYRPGYKTNPEAPWYDYGNKTFVVFVLSKQAALAAAKAWAEERYGIGTWERDPWGNWHPEGTMERALAAVKTLIQD